jgi:ABC-type multidrug transport system ATPase subunit
MSVLKITDLEITHSKTTLVKNVNLTIIRGEWFALVG